MEYVFLVQWYSRDQSEHLWCEGGENQPLLTSCGINALVVADTAQKGALRREQPRHGCVGRSTTRRAAISATRGEGLTRPPGTARCAADRHGAAGHGYARRKGGSTRLLTSGFWTLDCTPYSDVAHRYPWIEI